MIAQLSDDISLGVARLRVSDASTTGAWLERVLGLVVLAPTGDHPRYGPPGGPALIELRGQRGLRPVPRRGLLGLYHYAILLPSRPDLGRFLAHLERVAEPHGASDHSFSEALYLNDPDGITVEVYADRPRETWIHRGGDIVGTLDPLDREGLLLAAGKTPWRGAPQGTRMGHLHFYIGDLAVAERFYVGGLGFAVASRLFPGALFVAAGGYHHHVGLNVWAADQPLASAADAGLDS